MPDIDSPRLLSLAFLGSETFVKGQHGIYWSAYRYEEEVSRLLLVGKIHIRQRKSGGARGSVPEGYGLH